MINFGHPFNTFITDPAYNDKFNGATGMIMQSNENKEKVIEKMILLKRYNEDEYRNDKNTLLIDALKILKLDENDFFNYDWEEVLDAAARIA